jgi:hypothetical protein
MANTILNSVPCPTEDIATSSLAGMIAGYERGGHKVNVREMKTEETPAGWIAVVAIEIEDLEEEDEVDEPKESELKKAEEIIETQNALFYTMHHMPDSEAKRAFPEVDDSMIPGDLRSEEENVSLMYPDGQVDSSTPEDIIGLDSNADELSEVFESDFQEATGPDVTPEVILTEEELRRGQLAEEFRPEPQE